MKEEHLNPYSITSNEAKLYKHLDSLKNIQDGFPSPVLLHLSLTNKCNANCIHCCFSGRDKSLELEYDYAVNVINSFISLGIKSVELTGGGEPTMYKKINDILYFLKISNIKIGMNTNAYNIDNIEDIRLFEWIRVAMNVYDNDDDKMKIRFLNNVCKLKEKTKVTACYIVPQEIGVKNLKSVINAANQLQIVTRIAPDCIQSGEKIIKTIDDIKSVLNEYDDNKYCFCSDFNIYLGNRPDNICYMHYIKPFLYTDGNVYACPSSELDYSNGRDMNKKFIICNGKDVLEYYRTRLAPKRFDCGYCKYAMQNNIINSIMMETENNEFV